MITLATCEDQTEPENGRRQGEECGDVLEAVAVMQVRRDGGGRSGLERRRWRKVGFEK